MSPANDDTGAGTDHLSEEQRRIADYLSGAMAPEERADFERTVLADDRLSEAVYAEVNLESGLEALASSSGGESIPVDAAPAAPPRVVRLDVPWWRRLHLQIVLPVAAAAALAVVLIRPGGDGDGPSGPSSFRGPGDAIQALSPAGEITDPAGRFVWTRVLDATHYRFELYDETMTLVLQATVRDTQYVLTDADTQTPAPDAGRWKVTATNDLGLEVGGSSVQSYRLVD